MIHSTAAWDKYIHHQSTIKLMPQILSRQHYFDKLNFFLLFNPHVSNVLDFDRVWNHIIFLGIHQQNWCITSYLLYICACMWVHISLHRAGWSSKFGDNIQPYNYALLHVSITSLKPHLQTSIKIPSFLRVWRLYIIYI